MIGAAIFFTVVGLFGAVGRAINRTRPTRESLLGGGGQLQAFGIIAPYSLGLAVVCWVVVAIRVWA